MKLIDVVSGIEALPKEDTIYVTEPWSPDSLAVVALEPEGGDLPEAAQNGGMVYFLEVAIALEFLSYLEKLHSKRFSSIDAKTHRLIQYAVNDA